MKNIENDTVADAVAGYTESKNLTVEVFGESVVAKHPLIVFAVHDMTPDPIDPEEGERQAAKLRDKRNAYMTQLKADLKLAWDIVRDLDSQASPEAAIGVYDRIFGEDATGTDEEFGGAIEIAKRLLSPVKPTIDVVLEIFDRENGSPYESDDDSE